MAKPSWLSVTPTSGSGNGTISNSSSAHTGRVKREGVVTVQGNGVTNSDTYQVIQPPLAEFVKYDDTDGNIAVSKDGGKVTITGKSNSAKLTFAWVGSNNGVTLPTSYTAAGQTTSNGASISGDPGAVAEYEWNIALTFPANETTATVERTLKVTAGGGQTAQIKLNQTAGDAYLSVTPTEITIPQEGGTVTVQVTSNTSWTVL